MTLGGIGYRFAQQSGYNLTVNVTGHAFGNAAVWISVLTENGYRTGGWAQTAGGTSVTFNIPPDQGNSVQACVQNNIVGQIIGSGCQRFSVNGGDIAVNMAAG